MTEEKLIEANKIYSSIKDKTERLLWLREFIGNDSVILELTLTAKGKESPLRISVSNNEAINKVLSRIEKDMEKELKTLQEKFEGI